MKKGFIAVIDSGIGGLSVLKRLVGELPNEDYVYFSDSKNMPYGNRTERDLYKLTLDNILRLKSNFNLKAVVLGCNTLSMTIRGRLEQELKIKVFGVFPPLILSKDKKTLLLSTERTANEYKKYNLNAQVKILPTLAKRIEDSAPDFSRVDVKSLLPYKKGEFDNVILGCTHYDFVKNEIFDHLKPRRIFCGQDFTVNFIKNYYQNRKSLDKIYLNQVLFFGDDLKINEKVWSLVVENVKLYDKKV